MYYLLWFTYPNNYKLHVGFVYVYQRPPGLCIHSLPGVCVNYIIIHMSAATSIYSLLWFTCPIHYVSFWSSSYFSTPTSHNRFSRLTLINHMFTGQKCMLPATIYRFNELRLVFSSPFYLPTSTLPNTIPFCHQPVHLSPIYVPCDNLPDILIIYLIKFSCNLPLVYLS